MKYFYLVLTILFTLISCQKKEVDTIVFNAHIYCVDSTFNTAEAMAINNGKYVEIGTTEYILKKYDSKEKIDGKGQYIYPGLIDAHCHFYGYGNGLQTVDLIGTKSMDEVVERVVEFEKKFPEKHWILGRGWDQNDWKNKEFPTNEKLNQLFPNKHVILKRIDGHALLANECAINASNNKPISVNGGKIVVKNGKNTGIYIDNAMSIIEQSIPKPTSNDDILSLSLAQKKCFEVGLTSVCDAGLDKEIIELIDSLNSVQILKMRIYAMISLNEDNLQYYIHRKKIKTDFLNVRSFKVYADGALGSRGACLLHSYHDKPEERGFLLKTEKDLDSIIALIHSYQFQVNTHCIGDSANRTLLKIYAKHLKGINDFRWRIEHAQVVDPNDFEYFKNNSIIPSVQPTHATSDMYWASDRLGNERIKSAYAYKKLKDQNGMIANGSDFPVEHINPLYGFYAAVSRKDEKGYPKEGFQIENALTRKEALMGMTIWASYAQFEENEKGSIEIGKFADFVILPVDLMSDELLKIRNSKVISTYIGGKKVY